jgi:hypothetical protein
LQLNPEVLHYPSSMLASPFLSAEGHNLATTLARMRAEDPFILNDVSSDLADLVPGILKKEEETYTLAQIKNYLNSDSLNDAARNLIAG